MVRMKVNMCGRKLEPKFQTKVKTENREEDSIKYLSQKRLTEEIVQNNII